jgi:phosphoenolpyruvate-protein kinase (PTS system EI component)
LIDEGKSAAFAWRAATEETAIMFRQLGSVLLAERAADLTDVGRRVLKLLLGIGEQALELPQGSILIADQLTPSQTSRYRYQQSVGLSLRSGAARPVTWRFSPAPVVCHRSAGCRCKCSH